MKPAWLGLLFCLAAPALAAEDAALSAIEACRARLDARTDVGVQRIAQRCPELLPALQTASWGNLLPKDMLERREEISAASLGELAAMIRAADAESATRPAPSLAPLAPVLAELGERGQQGMTRWERFKRWLQDKLERREREQQREEESWIDALGRKLQTSEGLSEIITYCGYALMSLLVLLMIWAELRAAGLLGGRRGGGARSVEADWRRRLQLADVLAAPLAERPGLLLQLMGEALMRARRLPTAAGLSARMLANRARLDSDTDRAELEQLAITAEAARYAPHAPGPEQLHGAVEAARGLLDRLTTGRKTRGVDG